MIDEILPGVFDVTVRESEGRRNRVYLVDADVPTLVDTGFEETTDALFEGVEAAGLEPERLVLTHGDTDHVGGFPTVTERYDLESWAPAETTAEEAAGADHRYEDGDVIGPFEAVHAPGHEADNYALVDEDAGYVIPGDALFGADLRGLGEGNLIPPPALYSENINRAEASMEKLLDYDFDAALVFHGTAVTEGAHERLDAFINFPGKPGWASYERE